MTPTGNPKPKELHSKWQPLVGWLFLLPVEAPERTEGKLYIPDTARKKKGTGICVRVGSEEDNHFLQHEVIFPENTEYQVADTLTDELFYVVKSELIIMTREYTPPPKFFRVPNLKGESQDADATLQSSNQKSEAKII